MKTAGICFLVAAVTSLVVGQNAAATPVDFNFSISYSGSSITGRLMGLNLDGSGNGTEVDPSSVQLFTVPASVGLAASPSHPYVFVPHTFERSTYFSGTLTSTTPSVYGFQVSKYTMNPPVQNLMMIDSGNDVSLVFNFGASLGAEGGVATYGIQAEEDSLWPAINSFVSFTAMSLPGDYNHNGLVDASDYVVWRKSQGTTQSLPNDPIGGTIGTAQYGQWRAHFGQPPSSGSGANANAAVPEPSKLMLLLFAAVCRCLWRRRAA